MTNISRVLTSDYSLLHFFLVEPLIVLSDCLDTHHSFLDGLHIRQPILILYELGGDVCLPVGHKIVPFITVICDMVPKLLDVRYTKYINDTTDIEPCLNTTIVTHPVGLGSPCIGIT